jgi:hypothetical protein
VKKVRFFKYLACVLSRAALSFGEALFLRSGREMALSGEKERKSRRSASAADLKSLRLASKKDWLLFR